MQKFVVAFYLVIFFNNTTLIQAAETERFPSNDVHSTAKQLNAPPLAAKIDLNINPNSTHQIKNISLNTYTYLTPIQKNLWNSRKTSFITFNNLEQYAKSMRFVSCSFADTLRHEKTMHGMPNESEIAAALRLAENQFVTRSQQSI